MEKCVWTVLPVHNRICSPECGKVKGCLRVCFAQKTRRHLAVQKSYTSTYARFIEVVLSDGTKCRSSMCIYYIYIYIERERDAYCKLEAGAAVGIAWSW